MKRIFMFFAAAAMVFATTGDANAQFGKNLLNKAKEAVSGKSAAWDIRFFVNPDEEDGYVEFQGLVFGNKTTLTLIIDEDGDLAYTLQ